jgi:hypothetical protein
MEDGQKTQRGHPDFNSHVKILRISIFRTNTRTDRTEKLIWCGLGTLIGSSRLTVNNHWFAKKIILLLSIATLELVENTLRTLDSVVLGVESSLAIVFGIFI